VRLTLQVGAKYFGCVVCRFHIAAGTEATHQIFSRHRQHILVPLPKSASNNLRKWFLSPTGRLNFGFITEEKLTVVLITPYSWGSQLVYAPTSFLAPLSGTEKEEAPTSTTRHQSSFLAMLPGRKRISARGVSHFQSFYFFIILLSFFTLFLFAYFYQKYKKISSFYSCYFCLSVLVLLE
jgi:hypothetical protein